MRNVGSLIKLLEEYDEDYKGYEYEKKLLCEKMDDVLLKKSEILGEVSKLKREVKLKIFRAKYKFGCLKEFNNISSCSYLIWFTVSNISYYIYNDNMIKIIVSSGNYTNFTYYLRYNPNTNDIILEHEDYKNPNHHENYLEFFKFVCKNYKTVEKYVSSIENRIDSLFDNYLLAIEFLLCTISRPSASSSFPRDIRYIIANKILFFLFLEKTKIEKRKKKKDGGNQK